MSEPKQQAPERTWDRGFWFHFWQGFTTHPLCNLFGHSIVPLEWSSPRVAKCRCTRCERILAVHCGGISGIPVGAAIVWDGELDELYSSTEAKP